MHQNIIPTTATQYFYHHYEKIPRFTRTSSILVYTIKYIYTFYTPKISSEIKNIRESFAFFFSCYFDFDFLKSMAYVFCEKMYRKLVVKTFDECKKFSISFRFRFLINLKVNFCLLYKIFVYIYSFCNKYMV